MDVADTRTRLVLSAMQLFWEKGYGSTSIADVLQKARVNSGSLYHFFPGKQDLLHAVLDMYQGGIGPMLLEPAWAGVDDPIEKIFALLARYRRSLVDTDCFYGCPIGSLALELHEPDLSVRERLALNFLAWLDAVHGCLLEAGTRLPQEVNRRELAQLVLSVMEGGVMQARTFRNISYFDASVRQLRGYVDGLLATAGIEVAGNRSKGSGDRSAKQAATPEPKSSSKNSRKNLSKTATEPRIQQLSPKSKTASSANAGAPPLRNRGKGK